ncbi:hypothetical protein MCP1_30121 [Candidatus Terasakiella magnetica]|nr:hypothetical protein MCP1_30121 [Candidatus Terasakiella magnetica]
MGLNPSILTGFSRFFNAFTPASNIPAPVSAWLSVKRSSSAMVGGFGWSPSPARAAPSAFRCLSRGVVWRPDRISPLNLKHRSQVFIHCIRFCDVILRAWVFAKIKNHDK